MANFALFFLSLLSLSLSLSLSQAATPPSPKALLLPVHKDAATNLLVTTITGRTPRVTAVFVVDLTTGHLWANCETGYKSSTFSEPRCGSPQCRAANTSYCHTCPKAARPFCHAGTCGLRVENPGTHESTVGEMAQDAVALGSTDGSNPGAPVQVPDFLFVCSPSTLVQRGLPKGTQGVAGLAQSPIALHTQLATRVGLKPIFTLCIPSTTNQLGVIFLGSDGPYSFLPGVEVSQRLRYTTLTVSPFGEYYINVKSIRINQKPVPLNTTLLSLAQVGSRGGTTFNTLLPYTVLEDSIFNAMTSFFANQLAQVPPVKPVAPFGLCYESRRFSSTLLGPGVPSIDLEMEGQNAVWSIFGLNSLLEARPGIVCLAFVNGGKQYRAAINIGTYQMQDVPLQFDMSRSRLGFGGPLSGLRTHCGNFNFTATS